MRQVKTKYTVFAAQSKFTVWLVITLVGACNMTLPADPAPPSNSPGIMPTLTPIIQAGWEVLGPGLERRSYLIANDPLREVLVVRVDPAHYTFRAHYRAGAPLSIRQWRDTLPGAVAIVNANFFDPQYQVLGLLVADGVAHGQSYTDRGGTLIVQDGQPRIRSNTQEPYRGEALEQAVQAFPMLVLNGQQAYTSTAADRSTRRTAIAQDRQGRILVMVTPLIGMTLVDLSAFLAAADMEIVNAFNLDGGGSSLLSVETGAVSYSLPSFDPVPAVLAIYPRG